MKALKVILLCGALALSSVADAKGGSSSGGGGHSSSSGGRSSSGGFSSGGSRPSSPSSVSAPRPNSTPSIAPNSAGGSTVKRPDSAPSISTGAGSRPGTSTTTTTTRTTSYSSRYVSPGGYYGGWGMGYGYSNGLLTGMIIANMMHPHNTVMYVGPGAYNNNALLYSDGRVVNQQGYQVGTYVNGQFTPVQNGAMVAQQVPPDAGAQYQSSTSQPVVLQKAGPSGWEIAGMVVLGIVCVLLFLFIIGVL
ncbi:hypothetical protein UFOVP71_337 [uncultured Caudovirales phage]|uniref:Uncharacterized protein n=1 Tax=uncultured Caudovirales phage TaxID=2100421 RepID=A0A6J5TBY0_9CAUD|nr:hypothetical protein UFOVP71_337 [uncultured Caudovirales phage]